MERKKERRKGSIKAQKVTRIKIHRLCHELKKNLCRAGSPKCETVPNFYLGHKIPILLVKI